MSLFTRLRTWVAYELEARAWKRAPEAHHHPLPWHVLQLRSWLVSPGWKHASSSLVAYERALASTLDAANPRWYDELLMQRDECRRCGQTWLVENASFCTNCEATYGPCCSPGMNARCPVCRRGEIVG